MATDETLLNYEWAGEQFDHFIRAWAKVVAAHRDPAQLYAELFDHLHSRHGSYLRAMALMSVMRMALQEGAYSVKRIHTTEDPIREDIADQLAAIIWDIRKSLFGTEHAFLVSNICEQHGIDIGSEAA